MTHKRHTAARSLLFYDFTRSSFCTHEHDLVLVFHQPADKSQGVVKRGDSVLKVDDMDFVACPEDVLVHLWIPESGLVAKVRAGLQQLAHAYLCHKLSLSWVYLPLS